MPILSKLSEKIKELRDSGMSSSDIKIEGLLFLKKTLNESSLSERKKFFLQFERNKKLKDILGE